MTFGFFLSDEDLKFTSGQIFDKKINYWKWAYFQHWL